MLISDLVSEVIGEIGGDSSDSALANKVFGFMRSGMRLIPTLVRSRALTAQKTFIITANLNFYDLTLLSPSFIRERDGGFWYVDNNNKRVPIYRLSLDMFNQQVDQTGSTYPRYYDISNKQFNIDRPVSSNLTIYVDYFTALTNSLATSSTFTLGEDHIELVKFLTKRYYYEYQEDMQKKDSNTADAKVIMDELEARYQEDELGDFPDET